MYALKTKHALINVVCIMIHKLTAIRVLKAVSYPLILSSLVKPFIGNMITFVVAITQLMSRCFITLLSEKLAIRIGVRHYL